jgi:hypothetical protein
MSKDNDGETDEAFLAAKITDEELEAMSGPDILTHYYHCSWVGCETVLNCPQ